jgi:hypothetical protein
MSNIFNPFFNQLQQQKYTVCIFSKIILVPTKLSRSKHHVFIARVFENALPKTSQNLFPHCEECLKTEGGYFH